MAMAMKVQGVVVLVVVLTMMVQAVRGASGKEYQVKWDFPNGDNFYSAVQGKTYYVGDTLTFNYMEGMHNVVKVGSFDDFNQCTMSKPLSPEYDDGMTSLTLDKPGAHYFICSIPGHCADGMKIKVLAIKHPKSL